MARVRRANGTFQKGRNTLPNTMNTRAKRPRVTYESVQTLRDLGKLIHKEYPHVSATEGAFIAQIVFFAIQRSLTAQCKIPKKRRTLYIRGFGTFYARSIPAMRINNAKHGLYDLPAQYRLSWKAASPWKALVKALPVLPGPDGQFYWAGKPQRKRKKAP